MDVTVLGMVSVPAMAVPAKALVPMVVTALPRSRLVTPLQPEKAWPPMDVAALLMTTLVI